MTSTGTGRGPLSAGTDAAYQRQLRPGDTLARLGGDEFAVLVSRVRSRDDVEEIAARLECCFDEPFEGEGYLIQGSASIGIALYPEDADPPTASFEQPTPPCTQSNTRGRGRAVSHCSSRIAAFTTRVGAESRCPGYISSRPAQSFPFFSRYVLRRDAVTLCPFEMRT